MLALYHEIIYRPLLNILIYFYNVIPPHDLGIVIILLTVLIRLALWPTFHKQMKAQKSMNALQPKLNEVREKHKDNKEQQAKAIMDLYKEHNVNPWGSCLPLILQLPLLIAMYQVFRTALNNSITGLYSFVTKPVHVDPYFLHFIDLSKPNIYLAVIAGVLQFWQSKMMMAKNASNDPTAKAMALQTTYVLPILSVFIAWKLPAGLPLYWIVTTLFAVLQQYYILNKQDSPKD